MKQRNAANEEPSVPAVEASQRSVRHIDDIDRHVGARVRERRILLGLTQQQVADHIGVMYQQFAKYERGLNRISAGRLFGIARALSVEVSYFFEGLDRPG